MSINQAAHREPPGPADIVDVLRFQMQHFAPPESDGVGLGMTDRPTMQKAIAEIERLRALGAHRPSTWAELWFDGQMGCSCGAIYRRDRDRRQWTREEFALLEPWHAAHVAEILNGGAS